MSRHVRRRWVLGIVAAALSGCGPSQASGPALQVQRPGEHVRFAVIGDYGYAGPSEAAVAELVAGWSPDFVITLGDNNYPYGRSSTIDDNVGQYYHAFIAPYPGRHGEGADTNRFFPALGNHDWRTPGARPYLEYFTLPGNERYYDFAWGPVHLFALDSDVHEPDGYTVDSTQAAWLRETMSASTLPWQVVYLHHSPWSSGEHGSNPSARWPYGEWGADAVMSGHDHHYERIERGGTLYFVNGLGGNPRRYEVGPPVSGSEVRFRDDHGAMLVEATAQRLELRFVTVGGREIDRRVLTTDDRPRPERTGRRDAGVLAVRDSTP